MFISPRDTGNVFHNSDEPFVPVSGDCFHYLAGTSWRAVGGGGRSLQALFD